jgi:hypothetical protein
MNKIIFIIILNNIIAMESENNLENQQIVNEPTKNGLPWKWMISSLILIVGLFLLVTYLIIPFYYINNIKTIIKNRTRDPLSFSTVDEKNQNIFVINFKKFRLKVDIKKSRWDLVKNESSEALQLDKNFLQHIGDELNGINPIKEEFIISLLKSFFTKKDNVYYKKDNKKIPFIFDKEYNAQTKTIKFTEGINNLNYYIYAQRISFTNEQLGLLTKVLKLEEETPSQEI